MTKCALKGCNQEVPARRASFSAYHDESCAFAAGDYYVSVNARSTRSGGIAVSPQAAEKIAFWASLKRTNEAVKGLALHYNVPIGEDDSDECR